MLRPKNRRRAYRTVGRCDSKRGAALLTVMLFSVAAGGMTMVLIELASSTSKTAQLQHHKVQAEYLADAGIEAVRVELQAVLLEGEPPLSAGSVNVNGLQVDYTVTEDSPEQSIIDNDGVEARVTDYVVETRAEVDGAVAVAHSMLRSKEVYPYQFAVFYDTDAWLTTATTLRIDGRVHVNGDFYIGGGHGRVFLDTNYVRTAQNYYGYRADKPNATTDRVSVFLRKWVQDPFDSSEPSEFSELPTIRDFLLAGITSTGGLDSAFAGYDADGDGLYTGPNDFKPLAEWALEETKAPDHYYASGVTFQTSAHGVGEIAPPERGSIAPYEPAANGDYIEDPATGSYVEVAAGTGTHAKGNYFADAGLAIIKHSNGTWNIYDELGFDVTAQAAPALTDYSFFEGYRENTMEVLKLDLEALTVAGLFPDNGLIYYAADGASETLGKGLQLSNGAELPAALTVASDNAVLVQGDYNVVDKKPASVIGDRIHVLSNDWSDSKPGVSLPSAGSTDYNFVAVTGTTQVSATETTGGVQNLLKMHENWIGKQITYRGALMALYESKYDPGWPNTPFVSKNKFGVPAVRDFGFDQDLLDSAGLPPFAQIAIEVKEIIRF